MSETPEQRVARVKAWSLDETPCRVCGMRRINVIHEPYPDTAPEGKAYYDIFRDRLHEFVR